MLSFFICMALLIASCKKGNNNSIDTPSTPVITAKGLPAGLPVSKTIGAAGGQIQSADGLLLVTVAAGTVAALTEFSIEPITNTLYPQSAAYRLKPEGVIFSKPVSLQFNYQHAGAGTQQPDLMAAAWQTPEGAWRMEPTALDKTAKTLTVETTHFSDWTQTVLLDIRVEKPMLFTADKTALNIYAYGDDGILAFLNLNDVERVMEIKAIRDWRIIKGTGAIMPIVGNGNYVPQTEYTAPDNVTGKMDVEISVDLEGRFTIRDPRAPAGVRTFRQLTLLTQLSVVNNGMTVRLGNTEYVFNGNEVISTGTAAAILIQAENDQALVTLSVNGAAAGSYPCGSILSPGKAGVGIFLKGRSDAYGTSYFTCPLAGGVAYSTSPVNILSFPEVGKSIEGSFTGTVFQNNTPNPCPIAPALPLSVQFTTPRTR